MKNIKTVIIGGVAGGATAAARLRRLDEHAEIVIFERGEYISFANCGLPYYIGGEIKRKSSLTLQTPESFSARFNVDVRVFNEVTAINKERKTVTVNDLLNNRTYEESYDNLIISTGASPTLPQIESLDDERIFTLRNIPDTYRIKDYVTLRQPHTALVVGGGFIGMEMTENLVNAGVKVSVATRSDRVMSHLDYDSSSFIHNELRAHDVKLLFNSVPVKIIPGKDSLEVSLSSGITVKTDMIILALGVTPDSKIAIDAGLEVNLRGAVKTDKHMRTSDPSIYAVGDVAQTYDFVTGEPAYVPLAGPANKQGRIAADNIAGIPSQYKGTQGSAIVKIFDLTVAYTGMSEREAAKRGIDYGKSHTFSPNHATYYPNPEYMSIKTVFDKKDGKILGAQIVGGEGVDKRCDVIATAIRAGMTAYDLTDLDLCYAPPYGSAKDPVNMVGYTIENLLTGKVKNFFSEDIEKLLKRDDVTLLDTRTKYEYERGHIRGFVNIPLDELRANLHLIDKSKPVYLTCQVGQRGYVASRILSQNGYDVYNLSGGYNLYSVIESSKNS